jgi:hypothetical protein
MYFSTLNPSACNQYTEPIDLNGDPDMDISPFVLAERGGCSFVTKARNIQNWRGKVAVIIDRTENDPESTIMIDDGSGSDISIATILISQKDGDKLKKFYLEDTTRYVHLGIEFKINAFDNRVEYDIFYSLSDFQGLSLISAFKSSNQRLGKKVLFTPHIYTTYDLPYFKEQDCISNGKYCMPVQDISITNTGKELIEEGLRQICIYNLTIGKNNAQSYWDYIDAVQQECPGAYSVKCSNKLISKVKVNIKSVEECFNKSFSNGVNTILEMEHTIYLNASVQYIPAVIVNNITLRGRLENKYIFQTICNGFDVLPVECTAEFVEKKETKVSGLMIVMLILMLLVINLLLFYFYKRSTKKDINTMDMYVSAAVTNYMAMKERNKTSS